jgi:hypothetical protein
VRRSAWTVRSIEPGSGQVEVDLEIIAPAVGVHRYVVEAVLSEEVLGGTVELAERLESHQHGCTLSLTLEQLAVCDHRASNV